MNNSIKYKQTPEAKLLKEILETQQSIKKNVQLFAWVFVILPIIGGVAFVLFFGSLLSKLF